jgi:hypothetical protein
MHPAINREVSATRIADFYRQARRDATALAAVRALRARKAQQSHSRLSRIVTRLTELILAPVATSSPHVDDGT